MAVDAVTVANVGSTSLQGWQCTWGPMANGDTGTPISSPVATVPATAAPQQFGGNVQDMAGFSDRSVQVTGTFGSGGSCSWEGSNDGVNWFILTNPQGTAITFTSAGLLQVTEAVIFARPHVTAGDVTTALTVVAFCRRTYQQPGFPV